MRSNRGNGEDRKAKVTAEEKKTKDLADYHRELAAVGELMCDWKRVAEARRKKLRRVKK